MEILATLMAIPAQDEAIVDHMEAIPAKDHVTLSHNREKLSQSRDTVAQVLAKLAGLDAKLIK